MPKKIIIHNGLPKPIYLAARRKSGKKKDKITIEFYEIMPQDLSRLATIPAYAAFEIPLEKPAAVDWQWHGRKTLGRSTKIKEGWFIAFDAFADEPN